MNDQLNNLERSMGRVEGKIDGVLIHLEKINGRLNKHGERLDGIEQETAKAKGVAAGISMVVSIIIATASYFLRKQP